MKVSIRDVSTLNALKPLEAIAYLKSKGWKQESEKPGISSTWIFTSKETGEFEIALPLDHSLRDFPQRMADALVVLEAVEQRSQLDVLRDLLVSSADVIRVGLTDSELADGTLPIEDGAIFFQKAKDMMLAAACSAAEPKPYYPSRKPNKATDYLRKVRLGQTEHGSFVLTIISRVNPILIETNGQLFESEEPFERKVTETLATALSAVAQAADDAATSGKIDSFVGNVKSGVSANLCDAIVGMVDTKDNTRQMNVSFSWSTTRPLTNPQKIHNKISFSPDRIPFIKEAARHFKEKLPRKDFHLLGPVVKLERNDGDPEGKVTIFGTVDDQPRKVTFKIGNSEYQQSTKAHVEGKIVRCFGVLHRKGKTFSLKDIHGFSVENGDDDYSF